ncbi:MAG: hypothetical protein U1F27_00060 [Turneriella sp.]
MFRGTLFVTLVVSAGLCARPYSGRVRIAAETLAMATDLGIPYQQKLDTAIDGSASDFREFILIGRKLDTAGAYFHYFHVYEVAEMAGDARLLAAAEPLNPADLALLADGLREARGWLKGRRPFATAFPRTFAHLQRSVKVGKF